jgi:hypothetical protein
LGAKGSLASRAPTNRKRGRFTISAGSATIAGIRAAIAATFPLETIRFIRGTDRNTIQLHHETLGDRCEHYDDMKRKKGKWIKLSLLLAAAVNFVAFTIFVWRSPTARIDPGPALNAARAQVDRLSAITPEKDALNSHIVAATRTSQALVRSYTRLEVGLFVFEIANIGIFGALFLAIVFSR